MGKRLLIADDHEIFRRGVKQILLEIYKTYVIDEASSEEEIIEKISSNDYDAILLDMSVPRKNSLDMLRYLKNYNSKLQILIISTHPEKHFAISAFKAGAAGYITKAATPEELSYALQELLSGNKYITSAVTDSLISYFRNDREKALHETLSNREYEVLCKTAVGKSVKEIAMELSLSDKTISTYRSRILNKMNMNNITQLIHYAIENQLIEH